MTPPDDSHSGGQRGMFPITRHSAIIALRDGDEPTRRRAMETVIAAYWKPVYLYLRRHWQCDSDEAEDFAQGFFLQAMDKRIFDNFNAAKGRFRTYLRVCLDRFLQNERQSAGRQKRGGGLEFVSLDFAEAEREFRSTPDRQSNPERLFEEEWVRSLLSQSVDRLRTSCEESGKSVQFTLFERYDLGDLTSDDKTTYAALAEEFNLSTETVTNYLAAVRREFRRIVLDILRELTVSDEEFRAEVRTVLGIDIP